MNKSKKLKYDSIKGLSPVVICIQFSVKLFFTASNQNKVKLILLTELLLFSFCFKGKKLKISPYFFGWLLSRSIQLVFGSLSYNKSRKMHYNFFFFDILQRICAIYAGRSKESLQIEAKYISMYQFLNEIIFKIRRLSAYIPFFRTRTTVLYL